MDLIIESLDDNKLYVKYTGKIYIENSNDILTSITNELGNKKELIFDFTDVPYISSAGLRMLHSLYKVLKEQNASMYIKNANKEVRNVFEISGFLAFFSLI